MEFPEFLEFGESYEKFKILLKKEFKIIFRDIFGKRWMMKKDLMKNIYIIVFLLKARCVYYFCGGYRNLKVSHKIIEIVVDIFLFHASSNWSDDQLLDISMMYHAGCILGRRMTNKCCNNLCGRCVGEYSSIYPSYEDADDEKKDIQVAMRAKISTWRKKEKMLTKITTMIIMMMTAIIVFVYVWQKKIVRLFGFAGKSSAASKDCGSNG